jgi:chromate transporter
MAVLSFLFIFFFNVSFPLIILGAILTGYVLQTWVPSLMQNSKKVTASDDEEKLYYLNKFSPPITKGLTLHSIASKLGMGVFLWMVPMALFYFTRNDFSFWLTLSFFFTKAAFVTIGGAYAVLPYVAQVSVEKFQWLTSYQMIDGLALGETTPGPLIIVLVFVGFMAAYNKSGSLADGTLGLFSTAFYTFLPSFIFIFSGAPLVEHTQQNERLKRLLSFVTAAIVGVILNLTIYLGNAVLLPSGLQNLPDLFSVGWLLISFIALFRFRVNMMLWIGISALAGLLYHMVF